MSRNHKMFSTAKFPVAFMFVNDGNDWHGGLNYFRSLFLSLQSLPYSTLQPVAFIGARVDAVNYNFPSNVQVIQDAVFDRLSLRWILNKLAKKLFGAPLLTNRTILQHGVETISHSSPSCNADIKSIGWIPDFQHIHLPHFFGKKEREDRTKLYLDLIEKCDIVVVSSDSARNDLQRFAPQFVGKARVLRFCAIRPDLAEDASIDVCETYGLHAPYFYIPNQTWAHKNHLTAIRAFNELQSEYPDVKVVCSGSLSDYRNPGHLETLRSEIARHGLDNKFILLGVIPYRHIAYLMRHSVAVINPSLFEGWSTTVEEAKALGVPLILSDINVHREQCEHGEATFFHPMDATALADLMRLKLSSLQSVSALDIQIALERHHLRAMEFARAYERIVADLRNTA